MSNQSKIGYSFSFYIFMFCGVSFFVKIRVAHVALDLDGSAG